MGDVLCTWLAARGGVGLLVVVSGCGCMATLGGAALVAAGGGVAAAGAFFSVVADSFLVMQGSGYLRQGHTQMGGKDSMHQTESNA